MFSKSLKNLVQDLLYFTRKHKHTLTHIFTCTQYNHSHSTHMILSINLTYLGRYIIGMLLAMTVNKSGQWNS